MDSIHKKLKIRTINTLAVMPRFSAMKFSSEEISLGPRYLIVSVDPILKSFSLITFTDYEIVFCLF